MWLQIVLEACEVFLLMHSKMNMTQKLLLTDIYKLHDAQVCDCKQLIYSDFDEDHFLIILFEFELAMFAGTTYLFY